MKFVILNKDKVTSEMLSFCFETSIDSLRISSENNTILKYEGTQPDCLNGYKDYTLAEIRQELEKSEWTEAVLY